MADTAQTTSREGGNGAAETAQEKAKEVASQAQDSPRPDSIDGWCRWTASWLGRTARSAGRLRTRSCIGPHAADAGDAHAPLQSAIYEVMAYWETADEKPSAP